jgi:hypothetical protein
MNLCDESRETFNCLVNLFDEFATPFIWSKNLFDEVPVAFDEVDEPYGEVGGDVAEILIVVIDHHSTRQRFVSRKFSAKKVIKSHPKREYVS